MEGLHSDCGRSCVYCILMHPASVTLYPSIANDEEQINMFPYGLVFFALGFAIKGDELFCESVIFAL